MMRRSLFRFANKAASSVGASATAAAAAGTTAAGVGTAAPATPLPPTGRAARRAKPALNRCASPTMAAADAVNRDSSKELYEVLPRYPDATVLGMLRGIDYMGTLSFAISGSVTAATCGLDMVGCTVVGAITALGGGTIRDCLFGKAPVFWLDEREYIYMAVAAAFGAFVCCSMMDITHYKTYEAVMFWSDTIGLGAFAVLGTMYAIRLKYPIFIVLVCTMLTCTGGGLIRDTLCRRPARVLYPYQETYAITTVLGGVAWIAARRLGAPLQLAVPLSMGTVIALRVGATTTNFALPTAEKTLEVQKEHAPELQPKNIQSLLERPGVLSS